jgi:DNA/RNA endonuclease G (NUC1)
MNLRIFGALNIASYCCFDRLTVCDEDTRLSGLDTSLFLTSSEMVVKSSNKNGDTVKSFIVYNTTTRNPQCTVEVLSSRNATNEKIKRPPFYAEPSVTLPFARIFPKDYTDSEFDRGHMIPAADFNSADDINFTFSMVNISPQNSNLNKSFWAKFEAWIRNLMIEDCNVGVLE